MTLECKPLVTIEKVIFSKAFDDDFAFMLREITSHTLQDMQTNTIEVEANRSALAKLKANAERS